MSDLKLTIIIILVISLVSIFVLIMYFRSRRNKENEIMEYCQNEGYSYNKNKSSNFIELKIDGEDFILISTKKSYRNPSEDDTIWELETKWVSKGASSKWPSFVIGNIPGNSNWNNAPDIVKNMAVEKLIQDSGLNLKSSDAKQIDTMGKSIFLLFEESPGSSHDTVQRLKPLLGQWPEKQILFIKSSPEAISMNITGCFIKDAYTLEKILQIGEAIR